MTITANWNALIGKKILVHTFKGSTRPMQEIVIDCKDDKVELKDAINGKIDWYNKNELRIKGVFTKDP